MDSLGSEYRDRLHLAPLLLATLLAGCFVGYWTYSWQGGGGEAAVGEEHEVDLPQNDAFVLTQDVLRGEGFFPEVKPDYSLITDWRKADYNPGLFADLVGVKPRYRYEVQVAPITSTKSKVVVNVRAEDMPDQEVPAYKASQRFDFFKKFDALVAQAPPPSALPGAGGVNYALLPNEDLIALAKRVTGNSDNWKQIAKDNGIKSPSEVSAFQTIWVRSSLLKEKPK